jgi:hypothetical protein
VQVHDTAADSERLLLARPSVDRRVSVLGATLVGEQDELLRAHPIGVHVDDDLQSDLVEPAQTEVRDLDVLALMRRQNDAGLDEHRGRPLARLGFGHGVPGLSLVVDWSPFTTRLPHTPVILGSARTTVEEGAT